MLNVRLNISVLKSTENAVLNRLAEINRLNGTSTIQDLMLSCAIVSTETPTSQSVSAVAFSASLAALPILQDTAFKDIALGLTISRSPEGSSGPLNVVVKLTGNVVLGVFNPCDPWVSVGRLVIDKASESATLVVAPSSQEHSLLAVGSLKLINTNLQIKYTFGHLGTACAVSLSTEVKLGTRTAAATTIFDGLRPSIVLFALDATLQLGELFTVIIAKDLDINPFQLSLSNVRFSYSWKTDAFVLPEPPGTPSSIASRTYQPGLNAAARLQLLGMSYVRLHCHLETHILQ